MTELTQPMLTWDLSRLQRSELFREICDTAGITKPLARKWLACGIRANVESLGEYLTWEDDELRKIPNFGVHCLEVTYTMRKLIPPDDEGMTDAELLRELACSGVEYVSRSYVTVQVGLDTWNLLLLRHGPETLV